MKITIDKNIVFTVTPEGYEALDEKGNIDLFKEFIKKKFKENYCIATETSDKEGSPVKPHFHIWFQDINCQKDTIRTQLIKQFNELKRVGQNGSNKMSSISYLKEDIQFYYLFKNYETSDYDTNMLLNESLKKKYKDIYLKLLELKNLGDNARFYRYCTQHISPQKITDIKILITKYIEYSVSTNKKRINYFDCQNNINYVLSRENPETLITDWSQRMFPTI